MTKKALISLDEIVEFAKCYSDMANRTMADINEWFDATLKKQNGKIAINVDGEPIVWGQNEKSID